MVQRRVLITGGAGFIGSHLCDRLIREGFRVICIDNLITGQLKNIEHLLKDKNFSFVNFDVTKPIKIRGRIDYILHFASPASPKDYLKFPIQTLKAGSLGTYNTLGLAKEKRTKYMLASTSQIYGDPLVHPQKEEYYGNVNCVGLRGCYDEAKRFSEAITTAYHRIHKIDIRIVRIFNCYGPRMRLNDGRAIPDFIFQVLNNRSVTVYGDGKQTRSFCYIDDMVEGILRLMNSKVNTPINLGNPQEVRIQELAKIIISLTSAKSKIVFRPLPKDDPKQRQPDISKARRIIGWQPKVSLVEGLKKTIEWFISTSSFGK